MDTQLMPASKSSRSDTLMVFLPGAFLHPDEFEREGFVSAVRERDVSMAYDFASATAARAALMLRRPFPPDP